MLSSKRNIIEAIKFRHNQLLSVTSFLPLPVHRTGEVCNSFDTFLFDYWPTNFLSKFK